MAPPKKITKKHVKKKGSFTGKLLIPTFILAAVLFKATTFLLLVGMLPTPMAFLVDRTPRKSKVVTVGALNLAGCSPFLFELWTSGNSFARSVDIVIDPKAIIVMYAAALIGYVINWAVSGVVAAIVSQRAQARLKYIDKRKKDLVERWGREVTGHLVLDAHGFALEQHGAGRVEKSDGKRSQKRSG